MSRIEFRLPDVGEGIASAEVVEWRVSQGDEVREDQPLVDVQTDKAVVEIPSPAHGVVAELRWQVGDSVEVGDVLVVIESGTEGETGAAGGDSSPAAAADNGVSATPTDARTPATPTDSTRAPAGDRAPAADGTGAPATARVLASPAIRRMARERGIDIATVAGSGPGGRIRREDLEGESGGADAGDRPSSPERPESSSGTKAGETIALRGLRRTIARRMSHAWQSIPHVIDYREADAGALLELRTVLRARAEKRGDSALARAMTTTPLMVKIACHALAEHPYLNSSIDMEKETLTLHDSYDIGIATSTNEGIIVPVVRSAERKSLAEIAGEITRLAEAARSRKIGVDDLRNPTFTVNNFGALGIWLGTPIINPPQVANLGMGRIIERPVVRDGEIVAAPIMALSVSGDHRVLDGDVLAAFVTRVVELIENPALLIEDRA